MMDQEETHPDLEFTFPASSPTPGAGDRFGKPVPMLDFGREARMAREETIGHGVGAGDDLVESHVMAVYERKRLAQLLAAKKKLRSFRERKAKKQHPSPMLGESPDVGHEGTFAGLATESRDEPVGRDDDASGVGAPPFLSPSPNPVVTTSNVHSRTRSKHLTPMDMALFTLPTSAPTQEPMSFLAGPSTSETMLAGRRKREALKPIRVQERGRTGTGFGSGSGIGLGLGMGFGFGFGAGDVQPEPVSVFIPPREKETGMSPLRGSPRSIENKKRRSFKKTAPMHRHSGSADSLRKLGSGFGWNPPARPGDEEERGIRTAPARLEGSVTISNEGPGLTGLAEPFSIPRHGFTSGKEDPVDVDVGLEMPGLDFAIPMDIDADGAGESEPFSFPQRRAFAFPQTEMTDERPVSVLPELAVVPSTPAWEEFALPALGSDSPGLALGSSSSPTPEHGAKTRFEGFKFGQPAPAMQDKPVKPTMPAFSFGKRLEPVVVVKPDTHTDEAPASAASMPSLPSTPTKKKRHSHTRSGSVSSYHAFLPQHTGVASAPKSPGMLSIDSMPLLGSSPSGRLSPGPSSPVEGFGFTSPVKAPGDIKLDREGALRTLEGARSGLASGASPASNLTWPMAGADGLFGRDGRRLSAGGLGAQGKRRSRKSLMMEKAQQEPPEVQIPDLDSDEEALDVSSPKPHGSAPSSPRPTSGNISAPASTRDSFDKMFKAPPAISAPGFGLTLAPTMGASVEPHLNTLVEEEEPEDEEPEATTPKATVAVSSPPLPSIHLRPLRLLSMSSESVTSSVRPSDLEDTWSERHSLSFERGRSASIESTPLSPSSTSDVSAQRASSIVDDSMRVGRRPRSWVARSKRASTVSLSGSVRTLNEVSDVADAEEPQTLSQAVDSKVGLPQGSRVRRRRSTTAHSIALGSFETCEDVALLREKLADAAMERMAMEQDIQDWRGRCGDLEKQLRTERQQSSVLRDRVRRLGDHLSQISSAAHPSEPTILEVDTPSQMMASMRDQLFKLAQEVERERKAKVDALANAAGLQVRLEALAPAAQPEHSFSASSARLRGYAFPQSTVGVEPLVYRSEREVEENGPPSIHVSIEPPVRELDFRTCCGRCRGNVIEL